MPQDDRTRLSPSATKALELVREPIEQADGLSQAAITETLTGEEFSEDNAEAVISELLLKGYLYEVNGRLCVTPT